MSELTLEQAVEDATTWLNGGRLDHTTTEILIALVEAIEAMAPVVEAAEAWADLVGGARESTANLSDAIDTYREQGGKK